MTFAEPQQLSLLDMPPRARRTDPPTSHAAAAQSAALAARHHALIVDCLKCYGPHGKDGIAARTRLDGVAVCRRLGELERAGLIQQTGRTVPSTAGRAEREWRIA
jgi:predicted ArsR family transcriptional regulator